MREYSLRAKALLQLMSDTLGEPAGVDEDKRCPMGPYEAGETVVDFRPGFGRGDSGQFVAGDLDRQVHLALMSDGDQTSPAVGEPGAEKSRHFVQRINGCREPDALRAWTISGGNNELFQAGERDGEMGAPLVVSDGVDLVDDYGADGLQDAAALFGRKQDEERFGSRDEDVRRLLRHAQPVIGFRVAGAQRGSDRFQGNPVTVGQLADLLQRAIEVLPDVVRKRLERRDIEHGGLVGEVVGSGEADKVVEATEESRKRLAGPRGS